MNHIHHAILSEDAWIYYRASAFLILYSTCFSFFIMAFTIYFSYSPLFSNEISMPVMIISFLSTLVISYFFGKVLRPKFLKEDHGHILEGKKSRDLHFNSYTLPIIPIFFSFVTIMILPDENSAMMANIFAYSTLLVGLFIVISLILTSYARNIINNIKRDIAFDNDI